MGAAAIRATGAAFHAHDPARYAIFYPHGWHVCNTAQSTQLADCAFNLVKDVNSVPASLTAKASDLEQCVRVLLCAGGHGSPQQGPLMPFPSNGRPAFGVPGVPMRPGQVPPGMQFVPAGMQAGSIIYAPAPGVHGNPAMHNNPGVARAQMFHPGMMHQGPHAMQLVPHHMGAPGGPGPPMDGHMGGSAHKSPEQRNRNSSGPPHFQGQHRP